ncbi:hypothetical protein GCM10023156_19990 [Novipirellula rosea]|uniref:Uncharacterized protein n=1 Tax=Novipirellula rosea TaxID=1031540 RepID=A0ABP8MM38_9BACT
MLWHSYELHLLEASVILKVVEKHTKKGIEFLSGCGCAALHETKWVLAPSTNAQDKAGNRVIEQEESPTASNTIKLLWEIS